MYAARQGGITYPDSRKRSTIIVDETFHQSRQDCYELTRVHHFDGHVPVAAGLALQPRLPEPPVAEVLTPQRTHRDGRSQHPIDRVAQAHTAVHADSIPLAPIADRLVERRILTPKEAAATGSVEQ